MRGEKCNHQTESVVRRQAVVTWADRFLAESSTPVVCQINILG